MQPPTLVRMHITNHHQTFFLMFVKQLLPYLGLYQKWQRSKVGQRDKNASPQLQQKQQERQEVLRKRCQNPWDATIRSMFLKSQQLRIFLKRSSRRGKVLIWSQWSPAQFFALIFLLASAALQNPPPKTLPQIHGSWRLLKTKVKHYLTIVMLGVHQSDTNTPLHGGITFPHLSCCLLLAASIQLPVTEELLRISCHTLHFLQ